MALADYRLCDKCGAKAFYDANLYYEEVNDQPGPPFRVAGEPQHADPQRGNSLGQLGDWAVLCNTCATSHKCVIVPLDPQPNSVTPNTTSPYQVEILGDDDIIRPDDFMRPLDFDDLATTSMYSGRPLNHAQWAQVSRVLGPYWFGQSIGSFNGFEVVANQHSASTQYEFCRGNLPASHILPPTESEQRDVALAKQLPIGKHAGKTLTWVIDHDPAYFSWMKRKGLAYDWCGYPDDF